MSEVTISTDGARLALRSPFHPDFPPQAWALGGNYDGDRWLFDSRDEQRVYDLAMAVYGTDGRPVERVTVRLDLDAYDRHGNTMFLAGREVLNKPHRDQTPRLGRGVIVAEGELCSYGGSMRYPSITWEPGTVLEVRDLPASLVRATIDNGEAGLVILDAPRQPADARPEPDWPGLVGRLQGTIANAGLALDRRDIEGARELFHDAQRRFIRIKD
jgi:hypothetical protein